MKFLYIFIGSILVIIALILVYIAWVLGVFKECDRTDYSPIIKKIAVPMQEELEIFHNKNKRFPTIIERNEMLKKVGYVMDGNICIFEGNRISIRFKETKYSYIFRSNLGRTGCFSAIGNDGHYTKVSCGTSNCIKWGQ